MLCKGVCADVTRCCEGKRMGCKRASQKTSEGSGALFSDTGSPSAADRTGGS